MKVVRCREPFLNEPVLKGPVLHEAVSECEQRSALVDRAAVVGRG